MDTDSGTDRDTDSNIDKGTNKDTDMGTIIVSLMYDNKNKGKDRCRYVPALNWFWFKEWLSTQPTAVKTKTTVTSW